MTDEEFRIEAAKHDADFENGEPIDIDGKHSVAFHSATCRYCAHLRVKAIVDQALPDIPWATTKAN